MDPKYSLYEYRIDGLAGRNKNVTKNLIKAAIEHLSFLKDKKVKFATNYFSTNIAWEELHADLPEDDLVRSILTKSVPGAVWGSYKILFSRESTILIWLKLEHVVDTGNMNGFVNGDPKLAQWNSGETVKALNILMSKVIHDQESPGAINPTVSQVSANK